MELNKKKLDYKWITIIVLVVIGLGVYFYKNYQIGKIKDDLTLKADSIIINQNVKMIKTVCTPLVWATRSEWLRNQHDEINILISDLVKEQGIQLVNVIGVDGRIVNSTNKKLEGSVAPDQYKAYLSTDTVKVMINDSLATVVAPVMGYNSKLGIIVLNYKFSKFKP